MNEKMQPMRTAKQHCLVRAMSAKHKVFDAQDAVDLIENDECRRGARRLLDCARADLEALDRLLSDYAR